MTSTATPADELRTAATRLRDLATRTHTTLERHDTQWTDLTVGDTAAKARPMVWSQYAAAMHPGVGQALAAWLETTATSLAASTHPGWQDCVAADALAVARAINAAV